MKKIALSFYIFIIGFSALLQAQIPEHNRLIYVNPLTSDRHDEFASAVSNSGRYSNRGWTAESNGKLVIHLNNRLPTTGTIALSITNFAPQYQVSNGKQTIFCFTSRPHSSLNLFAQDSLTSFMYLRTGTNFLNGADRCGLEFDTAFEGYTSRDKDREVLMENTWDPDSTYRFRFTWDHEKIWLIFNDHVVKYQHFTTPIERIRYLSVGGDDIYNTMRGPVYSDLKIYSADTDLIYSDKSFTKNVRGKKEPFGGRGLAVTDVDGDGLDDILVTNFRENECIRDILYIQQPDGSFADETLVRGIDIPCGSFAGLFFDADNDGDMDLFLTGYGAANRLYLNDSQGYFTDKSLDHGIVSGTNETSGVVAFDVDDDGDLDLFAVNKDAPNEMHINDGTGHFVLESRGANGNGGNRGLKEPPVVTVADIDGDNDFDIYISKRETANELYLNDGTGHFSEVAAERSIALTDSSKSATFADFDNDGDMDLVVATGFNAFTTENLYLKIFENDGHGYFHDRTNDYLLDMNGSAIQFFDANNDGFLDLYRLQNSAYDKLYQDRAWHFFRTSFSMTSLGNEWHQFEPAGACGADISGLDARSVIANDFDRDGDLDLFVSTNRFENVYLENETNLQAQNWIEISTVGPRGDLGGIGSKIKVYEAGHAGDPAKLIGHREVVTMSGYLSCNNFRQHFGLGHRTACDIQVIRSDGSIITQTKVAANQRVEIIPSDLKVAYYSGDGQTGFINEQLSAPFVVLVTNIDGIAQLNVPVQFMVERGNGHFSSDSVVLTDASGLASIYYSPGSVPDTNIVAAYVDRAAGAPVRFTAVSGYPTVSLLKTGGDGQSTTVGQVLADPIVVTAMRANGLPVANFPVVFTVNPGNGNLSGDSTRTVTTNANGLAAVTWTLATRAGTQYLFAVSPDCTVIFTATASTGPPNRLLKFGGDGQEVKPGIKFPEPFVVQVLDEHGNPVEKQNVHFSVTSGAGYLDGATHKAVVTDGAGKASVSWTAGNYLGPANKLEASSRWNSDNLLNSPITWTFPGIAVDPEKSSIVATDSVLADGMDISEITVTLRDTNNVVVGAGLTVKIFSNGSENTMSTMDTLTDGNGQVTGFLTSTFAEMKIIKAMVLGLDLVLADTALVQFKPVPESITTISGDHQVGIVGKTLPQNLTVRLLDRQQRWVSEWAVEFVVVRGGGNINGRNQIQVFTDNNGMASAPLTLGMVAGNRNHRVEVRVDRAGNSPAIFTASAMADKAIKLTKVAGDSQVVMTGQALPSELVVQALDQYDNPAANTVITFVATDGGLVLTSQPVSTDSLGFAHCQVGVGANSRSYHFTASLENGTGVQFVAVAKETPVNHPPYFTRIVSDTTIFENQFLEFAVAGQDLDGDPVTILTRNLPAGAVFTSDGNGLFHWTPTFEQAGAYQVKFVALDSHGDSTSVFSQINVLNLNRAPVIGVFEPADTVITGHYGTPIQFHIRLASDPDGDSLSCQWYLGQLLSGFDWSFTATPDTTWPIEQVVTATVFDRQDTCSRAWRVVIEPTRVELAAFAATFYRQEGVRLAWETSKEIENAGFNVFRSQLPDDNYQRLNSGLIKANPAGRGYYFWYDQDAMVGATYYYKLESVSVAGHSGKHGPVSIMIPTPTELMLHQNHPNPFNPFTKIAFELPGRMDVSLKIYNLSGQLIISLLEGEIDAGYHSVTWNGRDRDGRMMASGLYYYRLETDRVVVTRKLVLMK